MIELLVAFCLRIISGSVSMLSLIIVFFSLYRTHWIPPLHTGSQKTMSDIKDAEEIKVKYNSLRANVSAIAQKISEMDQERNEYE